MSGYEIEPISVAGAAQFLSYINTEKKIIYLGCAEPGMPTTDELIKQRLFDLGAFSLLAADPSGKPSSQASMIREYFTGLPPEIRRPSNDTPSNGARVDITLEPTTGRFLQAAGGMLLDLAYRSGKSIRSVVGETKTPRKPELAHKNSSIENRIIILSHLLLHGRNGTWISRSDLAAMTAQYGTKPLTQNKHLANLVDAGLVQETKHKSRVTKRKRSMVRIAEANPNLDPDQLLSEFIGVVGQIMLVDPELWETGYEKLHEYMASTALPYLMKRSFANTNHTGKSTVRKVELATEPA